MASSYDQINKIKEKYQKEIAAKDAEISALKEKLEKTRIELQDKKQQLFLAGEGKGERNRLEKEIAAKDRENKTLSNQIAELNGSKLIKKFSPERQELIKRIKGLKFDNFPMYNSLAYRFKNGLDDVIEIAALIKQGGANDMDFFTYIFRDNIVGLLEKMLKVILNKSEDSAAKYLVKLSSGVYQFPKDYYARIPELKDKNMLTNILYLINLQTTGYHGTQSNLKYVYVDKETQEVKKTNKFLNLKNEEQLDAIFTLLKFMYDVFTNNDSEINLMNIGASWYKTLN